MSTKVCWLGKEGNMSHCSLRTMTSWTIYRTPWKNICWNCGSSCMSCFLWCDTDFLFPHSDINNHHPQNTTWNLIWLVTLSHICKDQFWVCCETANKFGLNVTGNVTFHVKFCHSNLGKSVLLKSNLLNDQIWAACVNKARWPDRVWHNMQAKKHE